MNEWNRWHALVILGFLIVLVVFAISDQGSFPTFWLGVSVGLTIMALPRTPAGVFMLLVLVASWVYWGVPA